MIGWLDAQFLVLVGRTRAICRTLTAKEAKTFCHVSVSFTSRRLLTQLLHGAYLPGSGCLVCPLCYERCTSITSPSKQEMRRTTTTSKSAMHAMPPNGWFPCCANACAAHGEAQQCFRPPPPSGACSGNYYHVPCEYHYSRGLIFLTWLNTLYSIPTGLNDHGWTFFFYREERKGVGGETRAGAEAWTTLLNRCLDTLKENNVSAP